MCAVFSVVAFIFTICVATTVAAQSGALAGLGVAFISKPIIFEVHMFELQYIHVVGGRHSGVYFNSTLI